MRRIGVHTRAPGGTPQDAGGAVARLARWVVAHRGRIAIGWIALLVLAMGVARAAQPHYINNLSLPGTDSQRATDVLVHSFRAQSGDPDQIVLHTISGRITDADVRARVTPVLTRLAHLAHVTGVVSPYTPAGARAVSTDGRTAFATITFDDRPDALPKAAVDRVIAVARRRARAACTSSSAAARSRTLTGRRWARRPRSDSSRRSSCC